MGIGTSLIFCQDVDYSELRGYLVQQMAPPQEAIQLVDLESCASFCSNRPSLGYPIILTTWHLTFATIMTQILARTTTVLDGRKKVKMTGRVYLRAIVPIGVMFSLSLICGNMTYLYLSCLLYTSPSPRD